MTPAPPATANAPESVGISLVRAIVHEFERTGRDAVRLLEDAGIEREVLDDPWARLDHERYGRLQRLAIERSRDPAFGLTLGQHASLASFGLVGHMVSHCRTIRHVLEICTSYYMLAADADAPRLAVTGDRAELTYEFLRGTDPTCNRMRAEFGLTRLVLTARTLLGSAVTVDAAGFEHDEPPYAAAYRPIFGDAVRFGQRRTTLVFPARILDVRLVHHDDSVLGALRARADEMLLALQQGEPLAAKVRRVLVTRPGEVTTIEGVARRLGKTPRGLRRQLQQEGSTFQEVASAAMRDVACRLLRDSERTIQDTAYQLGFSEPSAFHRAFKRWTGMTPLEWRRSQSI